MTIPASVEAKLNSAVWKRENENSIEEALTQLAVDHASDFAKFFRCYWGPFHGPALGHELLDLVEQDESIISVTHLMRKQFDLPDRFLVVSTLTGNSLLIYDSLTQQIFDVDFEGGIELLRSGELDARWKSWNVFLCDFFGS